MSKYRPFPFPPSQEYSYTTEFQEMFPRPGAVAEGLFSIKSGILSAPINSNSKVIVNLRELASASKTAEQSFLNSYFGKDITTNNWGELIKGFNLIFSNKDIFERNLNLIKQVSEGDRNTYTQIESYFSTYLTKATKEVLGQYRVEKLGIFTDNLQGNMDKLLNRIIQKAMNYLYSAKDFKDKNGNIITNPTNKQKQELESLKAYEGLLNIFSQLEKNSFFASIKDLFNLETYVKDVIKQKQDNSKNGTKKRLPQIKSSLYGDVKGKTSEYFGGLFAKSVADNFKTQRIDGGDIDFVVDASVTGAAGVKSDITWVAAANFDLEEFLGINAKGQDRSNRVNIIQNYENFFNKMKDAYGHIVFISNKNYNINLKFSSRGGALAQERTTLENVGSLLAQVRSPIDVDNLIDVLSNSGDGMILGDAPDEILHTIATQIGHFLFDDLSIDISVESSGLNRVHLFNLSGVYVPLSVFLEATLHSLLNAQQHVDDFVRVNFLPGGPTSGEGYRPWGDDWSQFEKFRQDRIRQSYITIHFMKDFANFITQNVKI